MSTEDHPHMSTRDYGLDPTALEIARAGAAISIDEDHDPFATAIIAYQFVMDGRTRIDGAIRYPLPSEVLAYLETFDYSDDDYAAL